MLELEVEAHIVQRLLSSIKGLCVDLQLFADETGLSMQCMDECHAALTSFQLKVECFRYYRCTSSSCELGIKLETLDAVFSTVRPEDIVKLTKYDDEDSNTTNANGENDGGANSNDTKQGDNSSTQSLLFECTLHKDSYLEETIRGKIPLVDLQFEHLVFEEDIEGSAVVRLSSKNLAREVNVCKQLGLTTATLEVTRNAFTIYSAGETKYTKAFTRDTAQAEIRCARHIKQEFAIHYLAKFCKAATLGRLVKMQISDTRCSNFEFRICDLKGEPMEGKLVFQLAPSMG